MFGKGDNKYPGVIATEDIKEGDALVKVSSNLIINTKKAYYAPDLHEIFRENPKVFGAYATSGDDFVLYAFVLHEIQKKEKSEYWEMIKSWPADADVLLCWDDESLAELQDPTLVQEAEKQYNDMM